MARLAALVWLMGCLALVAIAVGRHQRWRRLIREGQPVTDRDFLDLFESAKKSMRVRRPIAVIAVEQLNTPAVFGLLQIRMLLPAFVLKQMSPCELRMVMLHELAHVRRNDLVLNWVLMAVQFLHWFNPLVWMALRRFRADRELVCDAIVLQELQSEERPQYGRVLLKLLESLRNETLVCSSAIPVMSGRREMKERILLIKHHRKASVAGIFGMALLLVALAGTTLTRATEPKSNDANSTLVVEIDKNGGFRLLSANGKLIATNRLREELILALGKTPGLRLNILVASNAPFAQVVKVMDLAKEAKARSVSLTTSQARERKPSRQVNSAAPLETRTNVASIEIKRVGPTRVSDKFVRSNINLAVGHEADSTVVDDDVRRLYATGYFYSVRVATESTPAGCIVTYILQDRPRVKAIKFTGNERFADAELLRVVSTKEDEPFDERKVFTDTQLIQKHYEAAGAKGVQVKYLFDLDEKTGQGIITFKVEENQREADRTFRPRSIRDASPIMKPDTSGSVTTLSVS